MAAINRPTEATYVIHEDVTMETQDNEDHTFCGIMFPVKCKELLPLERVIISSVSIRGALGPLTVWVTNNQPKNNNNNIQQGNQDNNNNNKKKSASSSNNNNQVQEFICSDRSCPMNPKYWTKVYEATHAPSYTSYCELDLSQNPIILYPGQIRTIYIHSQRPGDEAIVYDNRRRRRRNDDVLEILSGRAHVSDSVFGTRTIWGGGNPWRDSREFVGRVRYGIIYKLWNPNLHRNFGSNFQRMAQTLFLCQRRWESPISRLPDDCIYYILNMCRWDWAEDDTSTMKALRKRTKAALKAKEQNLKPAAVDSTSTASPKDDDNAVAVCPFAAASGGVCSRASETNHHHQDMDESNDGDDKADFQVVVEDYDADFRHEDEDDEDDEDEDFDSEAWEEDQMFEDTSYQNDVFYYNDYDSDDQSDDNNNNGDDDDDEDNVWFLGNHTASIRRQFLRIHVLRALAALDNAH